MQLVAINGHTPSHRWMPLTFSPDKAEQRVVGQVLKNLRERAGLTQKDVAKPQGMTAQGYQYYEAGERKFTLDRIHHVLQILKVPEHEYEAERARVLGSPHAMQGVQEVRADFVFDIFGKARIGAHGPEAYDLQTPTPHRLDLRAILGPTVDALEVADDTVRPWAESGDVVLFDRSRPPRRGKGCVVELASGAAHVKLYEKSDGSTLFVTELFPEERTVTYAMRDVKGVYPVVMRGD